jgi:nucleotide-binding universal stress UspA family protein
MKILCPTDLSLEANNAVAYAAKLAQETGSTLTLLNVQVLAELTPAEASYGEQANVQNAQNIFDRQSMEISALFKIDCTAIVVPSIVSLTSVIRDEARKYDLIVMGTDGPDTFIESMRGSKTYQLVASSDLPVLVIPDDIGYSDVTRILFAFDYRHIPQVPTKQVSAFAQATGAEVIMLQIVEERWTHQIETEIQNAQAKVRQSWTATVPLKFETVYSNDHDESLKQYYSSFKADIIAIGYRTRGLRELIFQKSKTRQIVADATFPLLVIHS